MKGMKEWDHQYLERLLYFDDPARGLFWSMRTGKSKSVIDLATELTESGKITGMIIVAPNGVHMNWTRRELPKHWPKTLTLECLTWISKTTKPKHVNSFANSTTDLSVISVNVEALQLPRFQKMVRSFLRKHDGKILIVFDESHLYLSPGSKRTRLARGLSAKCSHRRILTGTAALNSPLHLWSQLELLSPAALGYKTFGAFKKEFADYEVGYRAGGQQYPKLVRYKNLERLRALVADWVTVVPRSEVTGLPSLLLTERPVMFSSKQEKAYNQIVKKMESEVSEDLTIEEAIVRITKLRQVLSGFVLDEDGGVVEIDSCPPRFTALLDEILGTDPCRSIVWCQYREEMRRLKVFLAENDVLALEYHGGVNAHDRQQNIDLFQNWKIDKPVVFLAQPQAAGMGLELSNAEAVIWYSHSFDAIVRDQATERATKMNAGSVSVIDILTPGTVDATMLSVVRDKQGLADLVTGAGLSQLIRGTVIPIGGKHGETEEQV